ncbi:uncharacterized protein K452DRAFT_298812 [Aplosporella prunicola CBS 121167]|uniref:C2H2-type domain-containing protein n=1 Tax=Aplosporella prunicola CBS 121167 TaxID=1176127 RepID=A0A6A6BB25_9PEZI|nr:uncharacterized protein K452DRAFT_298812 [Aplosporella prunicola CBS 121167]KAF2141442.1 hypothetical protein K452DRAFT_298812 [Aplosporella prunicola CBS 121167]
MLAFDNSPAKRRSSYGCLPPVVEHDFFAALHAHVAAASLQVNVEEKASPVTPDIYRHIDAIKHLDDALIIELLRSARFYTKITPAAAATTTIHTPHSRKVSAEVPDLVSDDGSSSPETRPALSTHKTSPSVPTLRLSSRSRPGMPQRAASDGQVLRRAAEEKPLPVAPAAAEGGAGCSKTDDSQRPKLYVCTFCDEAFRTKAYWKTHEEEMHEQPKRWTCPDCYRTFHAEKKYRRHHAESHGCKHCAPSRKHHHHSDGRKTASSSSGSQSASARKCADRSVLQLHKKAAYGCGFCVTLLTSWSERCSHVAAHFERGRPRADWSTSNVVKSLMLQPQLAGAWEALLTREHGPDRAHWPWFGWRRRESRELLRSMEQQGMVRERAKALAKAAYDLGRIEDAWMQQHLLEEAKPSSSSGSSGMGITAQRLAQRQRELAAEDGDDDVDADGDETPVLAEAERGFVFPAASSVYPTTMPPTPQAPPLPPMPARHAPSASTPAAGAAAGARAGALTPSMRSHSSNHVTRQRPQLHPAMRSPSCPPHLLSPFQQQQENSNHINTEGASAGHRRSVSPATKDLLRLIDQEFPSGTFLEGYDPLDFRTPKLGAPHGSPALSEAQLTPQQRAYREFYDHMQLQAQAPETPLVPALEAYPDSPDLSVQQKPQRVMPPSVAALRARLVAGSISGNTSANGTAPAGAGTGARKMAPRVEDHHSRDRDRDIVTFDRPGAYAAFTATAEGPGGAVREKEGRDGGKDEGQGLGLRGMVRRCGSVRGWGGRR